MDEKYKKEKADGIYFLPGDEDCDLVISHWEFKPDSEFSNGKPEGGNDIGNLYQIAFFTKDDEGNPVYNDHFEAIIGDPERYLQGLGGCGLYGCMVKKTDKSVIWFEDYLNKVFASVRIPKLKQIAESIANT